MSNTSIPRYAVPSVDLDSDAPRRGGDAMTTIGSEQMRMLMRRITEAEAALLDAAKRYCYQKSVILASGTEHCDMMTAYTTLTQAEAALAAPTTETKNNG